jgi:ankyrin repeat protein
MYLHALISLFIDDVNAYDNKQRTPLHLACWLGNYDMIQCLLNAGASCGLLAQDGFTCLHFAAQKTNENTLNIVKLLLKSDKTLLNKKIFKGKKSVLHLAIIKNNFDVVQYLLESVNMNPFDKIANGSLPIDLTNDPKLKELILKCMEKKNKQKEKAANKSEGSSSNAPVASSSTVTAAPHVEVVQEAIFTLEDIEGIDDEEEVSEPVIENKRHQEEQGNNNGSKKAKVSLSHLEEDE